MREQIVEAMADVLLAQRLRAECDALRARLEEAEELIRDELACKGRRSEWSALARAFLASDAVGETK